MDDMILEIRHLSKSFGSHEVLRDIDFTVKKGDVIAMTGSTGMSTGIHCHYEIQLNGIYQNPKDYE